MTDTQAVCIKIEANIRPALFPLNLIMESSNAVEFNAFHLDRFGFSDNLRVTLDINNIIVVVVCMADCHDIRRSLIFRGFNRPAGFVGVDDYPDTFFRRNQERRDS